MDIIFKKSLSKQAKKLVNSIDDSILFDIRENVDLGVKNLYAMIVLTVDLHARHTDGMEGVCYDDIASISDRLKIMIEHK